MPLFRLLFRRLGLLLLRCPLLPGLLPGDHGGHQAVDVLAQVIEAHFVVRHHAHRAAGVEVAGDLGELKAELRDLLLRPVEELVVVGLEVDLAAGL